VSVGASITAVSLAILHHSIVQVNNTEAIRAGTLHLRYGRHLEFSKTIFSINLTSEQLFRYRQLKIFTIAPTPLHWLEKGLEKAIATAPRFFASLA
jgi:hypothetical protein